jgi:hypothetical protein
VLALRPNIELINADVDADVVAIVVVVVVVVVDVSKLEVLSNRLLVGSLQKTLVVDNLVCPNMLDLALSALVAVVFVLDPENIKLPKIGVVWFLDNSVLLVEVPPNIDFSGEVMPKPLKMFVVTAVETVGDWAVVVGLHTFRFSRPVTWELVDLANTLLPKAKSVVFVSEIMFEKLIRFDYI